MSNGLALATVTQALALLIANNLRPEMDMAVAVETRKPPAEPPAQPTITVFLYQVTPNASMRHNDLPTRASDGTLVTRPAAALDLHYVISAYGEEAELVGQRLIGCVVRTLHEIPVLPHELIVQAAERPHLAGSDLADSLQKVRFTPTQMDVDETSKLWGMLHQTPYSLSVVYQASLVLIEGREQPVPAKAVEERTVRVAPFGAPGAPERPVGERVAAGPAEAAEAALSGGGGARNGAEAGAGGARAGSAAGTLGSASSSGMVGVRKSAGAAATAPGEELGEAAKKAAPASHPGTAGGGGAPRESDAHAPTAATSGAASDSDDDEEG